MQKILWESAWDVISRIPWAIDGRVQDPEGLKRSLLGERDRFSEWQNAPLISLVTPMWNTSPRHLSELIASVQAQSFSNWELLLHDDASTQKEHLTVAQKAAGQDARIKLTQGRENLGISGARNVLIGTAKGAYVGILDHDDLLHPQALGSFARYLNRNIGTTFAFSNEYKISDDSKALNDFFTKCDFSLATLLNTNYPCHFTLVHQSLYQKLKKADGVLFRSGFDGAEDHDVFLRLSKVDGFRAAHLSLYVYAWRKAKGSTASHLDEKPKARERALACTREFLAKNYPEITVEVTGAVKNQHLNQVRLLASPTVKLAVAIPYKDAVDLTISCLDSLERQAGQWDMTVYLLDNRSVDPQTSTKIQAWLAVPRKFRYEVVVCGYSFNYARMHNDVFLKEGKADYFLFLNNDVVLTKQDALLQLVFPLLVDSKVAISGLKLFYPSGELQHAGIRFFCELRQSGFFRVGHRTSEEEFLYDSHAMGAVSFACAMMRASVFKQIDGLEEDNLPNGLGDVAACLSVAELGYTVFYVASSDATHHESKTRKFTNEDYEYFYLYEKHSGAIIHALSRSFGYNQFTKFNFIGDSNQNLLDKPLRYKVADAMNEFMKRRLYFLQKMLKLRLAR